MSDLLAFDRLNVSLLAEGWADVANGQVVTGNYHSGLGSQPHLGRLLTEDDDKPAAHPVEVLSYRYWQKKFGGDAAISGFVEEGRERDSALIAGEWDSDVLMSILEREYRKQPAGI